MRFVRRLQKRPPWRNAGCGSRWSAKGQLPPVQPAPGLERGGSPGIDPVGRLVGSQQLVAARNRHEALHAPAAPFANLEGGADALEIGSDSRRGGASAFSFGTTINASWPRNARESHLKAKPRGSSVKAQTGTSGPTAPPAFPPTRQLFTATKAGAPSPEARQAGDSLSPRQL